MKTKILIIAGLFVAAALIIASCGENNPTEPTEPKVFQIEPERLYNGGNMIVYGEAFGEIGPNSFAMIADTTFPSESCFKWNYSRIEFEIPFYATSGTFAVVADGDTSNVMDVTIRRLPEIRTVDIPAGTFVMGSETGLPNEEPEREVTISNAFEMSETEVDWELWNSVMFAISVPYEERFYPAEGVPWLEAVKFCNELSKLAGLDAAYTIDGSDVERIENSKGYRLPTEAEWEYVCRAGSSGDYGGGGSLAELGWFDLNSGYAAHPVASKIDNAWGLYDMHGNVWEWCFDYYDEDYYSIAPAVDPTGPASGSKRVKRGGSWQDGATSARCSNRTFPDDYETCGFRFVRTK